MEKLREVIRDDWSAVLVDNSVKASVEISGILSGLVAGCDKEGMVFSSRRFFLFRKLKKLWEISDWGRSGQTLNLIIPAGRKGRVSLRLDDETVLKGISYYGDLHRVESLSWHWLRGLFGSCGTLSLPRTGYYMSFRVSESSQWDPIEKLEKVLSSKGISFRKRQRRNFSEFVLRDQSSIVVMLSNMLMFKASLLLEEKALLRSIKERANKIVNCDASNIRKSLESAQRQVELARMLLARGDVLRLPDKLRELVYARLENPSATLNELGQALSRPVSKSTVKYRWGKIELLTRMSLKIEKGG
ncbi:MAG: putative sporulation transcription regulator WhiA [Synergistetes bacterium ADurb.Bin155]|jgi:hypothetical protein|nr:DNA-binding protein WhiA [Synergistales bacterium]MBP8995187.1 DNA-binding protein WhiA [Synergistales bacterium]NMD18293.1 DNA-binding protein WhiA [Synergistaceae bacterium]OQB46007.1 MAG: putative sporulation transcription regulator WhiA [Synergistetes bacterium ADurb.Bin155]HQL02734.1 DNA-binding protein WhiA [Synergistales bacterium]